MSGSKWMKKLVVQSVVSLLVSVSGKAYADAPAPKWYDTTTIGGFVQGSYVGNLSKDTPQTNQLRVYDSNNGFNLNQAQLHMAKPVGDDGYGFNVKFLGGHDAQLIHSTGLGNTVAGGTTVSESFDVEEANLTFAIPKVKGLTFTGGKFVTACGVEVIESPLNLMISPGFLFFYGMPFTHTGAKLAYTVNDKLSVMAGVVNGWDNVTDNNPGKTVIWQIAATPFKGVSASVQGSYGPELLANNISKRIHTDIVLGYTGINNLTLNAEYLWSQDSNVGGTPNSGTTPWQGAGLWAGYTLNNYVNPGARFEIFNDQHNANRLGSGVNQTAKNITVNNKFITSKNTFARVEYRHDWSNRAPFTRDDGSLVRNQNTIGLDWVVTF